MKTAIILSDGVKQIMFTPENENEKKALKMISPEDNIDVLVKHGSFHSSPEIAGYTVGMNVVGYLRAWDSKDSVMFVLTPKKEKEPITLDDLRNCFNESRLTNAMVGFKHDTFEEYLNTTKHGVKE